METDFLIDIQTKGENHHKQITVNSSASGFAPDVNNLPYASFGIHMEEHDHRIKSWNSNILRSGERDKHPCAYLPKPSDVDFVNLGTYESPQIE